MCVGSAMPVATLPVTAHRDRLSEWGNRSTHIVLCESNKTVVDRHRFIVQFCMKVVSVLYMHTEPVPICYCNVTWPNMCCSVHVHCVLL